MGDYDQVEFLLKCVNERKITGDQAYAMLGSSACMMAMINLQVKYPLKVAVAATMKQVQQLLGG